VTLAGSVFRFDPAALRPCWASYQAALRRWAQGDPEAAGPPSAERPVEPLRRGELGSPATTGAPPSLAAPVPGSCGLPDGIQDAGDAASANASPHCGLASLPAACAAMLLRRYERKGGTLLGSDGGRLAHEACWRSQVPGETQVQREKGGQQLNQEVVGSVPVPVEGAAGSFPLRTSHVAMAYCLLHEDTCYTPASLWDGLWAEAVATAAAAKEEEGGVPRSYGVASACSRDSACRSLRGQGSWDALAELLWGCLDE
jgi:hypothetical protein